MAARGVLGVRILMLGWEFPPFISGGLGTACYGLTRALDRLGHRVLFVLPKSVDKSHSSHVELISPDASGMAGREIVEALRATGPAATSPEAVEQLYKHYRIAGFEKTEFVGIPSTRTSPYKPEQSETAGGEGSGKSVPRTTEEIVEEIERLRQSGLELHQAMEEAGIALPPEAAQPEGVPSGAGGSKPGSDYGGDILSECQRYAHLAIGLCRHEQFDVIHAHDWMTYPAGMALARLSGKPLVAHIHSTEFDRSGMHVNQTIYDIERRGMHAAVKVIAVSMLTKQICAARYGVDEDKVRVVYNGIDMAIEPDPGERIEAKDKIVLFLGRITMQKGPEYFVAAAKRVLEKMENVKFVVAGNGDMARRMIELSAEMGIGHKVLFTGFLRGKDVARAFRMADCYVMPSVSEPFGIAPLEAMSHDTPVIISKQSGVSEVLRHALKVDFWDIDEMANKIIAVLRHPPLSQTLRQHGTFELRKLTWEGAAEKCVQTYEDAIGAVTRVHHHPVTMR